MSDAVTIMVVEDEAIIALDLSQQLRQFGYDVADVVHDGEDAILRVRENRPSLILMDIVLNGAMNGIEAAERINAEQPVPVIYLTSYSDPGMIERAARMGSYGYLTKPYRATQIRAAIEMALAKAAADSLLRETRLWYDSTLRSVGDAVITTDTDARITFVNRAAESLLGLRGESAAGRDITRLLRFESAEGAPVEHPVRRALRDGETVFVTSGTRLRTSDGRTLVVEDSVAPIRIDEGGPVLGTVLVMCDVTERIRLEQGVVRSEQRFRAAFELAASGLALMSPDGQLKDMNPAFCRQFDYQPGELQGRSYSDLLPEEGIAREAEHRRRLLSGELSAVQHEQKFRDRTGQSVHALVSGVLLTDAHGKPQDLFYQVHDITYRKRAEDQLTRLAHYDPLTGLANRTRLQIETQRAVADARRHGTRFAVLMLDLDNFKRMNDTFGHDIGDQVLRQIGSRLGALARETDVIARLGGDEFLMLVSDVNHFDDASVVADKIRNAIAVPIRIGGNEIHLSASIGISLFPDDGSDAGILFRGADSALYQAKARGRDTVAFYRSEFIQRSEHRLRLENDLRRAASDGSFDLHFQPIVGLTCPMPERFEALVRWRRDDRLEPPSTFIPVAEETHLIVPVGAWVLGEALAQLEKWDVAGGAQRTVSVNVSARQMREPGFLDLVKEQLHRSGIEPQRLCLEITENQLFGVTETELMLIEDLRYLGVGLSVDDFGVGYSSLSYLRKFNPSELKIDRSFVHDLVSDSGAAAIVSATIAMAHKLGVRVVAEGVETPEQLQFLRDEGCDAVQGYLLGRPAPAGELAPPGD